MTEACRLDPGHCITCGDEGLPMRVTELADGLAVCADADGLIHDVAVDLVPGVRVGAMVIVHAGVAIGAPR